MSDGDDESEVKFAELGPERWIICVNLGGALQGLQGAPAILCGELHFSEALIAIDLFRREGYRLLCITNRRVHLLEILGVNVSELEIGLGFFRLRFDRVFENIDRAWVIPLLSEEEGDSGGEINLTGINIQDTLESGQCLLAFTIILKVQCLHVIQKGARLALAFWLEGEVLGRVENERVVLWHGFGGGGSRSSGSRFVHAARRRERQAEKTASGNRKAKAEIRSQPARHYPRVAVAESRRKLRRGRLRWLAAVMNFATLRSGGISCSWGG